MNSKRRTTSPVAERLRSARLDKGISQKQLGILAGIDQFSASPRINQYEKGKHVPDYGTSVRLAEALSIPVTYLYADDEKLAELILLFSIANSSRKKAVLKELSLS